MAVPLLSIVSAGQNPKATLCSVRGDLLTQFNSSGTNFPLIETHFRPAWRGSHHLGWISPLSHWRQSQRELHLIQIETRRQTQVVHQRRTGRPRLCQDIWGKKAISRLGKDWSAALVQNGKMRDWLCSSWNGERGLDGNIEKHMHWIWWLLERLFVSTTPCLLEFSSMSGYRWLVHVSISVRSTNGPRSRFHFPHFRLIFTLYYLFRTIRPWSQRVVLWFVQR